MLETTFDAKQSITDAWAKLMTLEQDPIRSATGQSHLWASTYHPCARYHYLRATTSDLMPWTADQLARFRRGKRRERDLKAELDTIGPLCDPPFERTESEAKFFLADRAGRVVITGKVDCKIRFENKHSPELGVREPESIPVEIKAWSPYLVDRINTFEDIFTNRYTLRGGYQLLCYMYGNNCENGLLLLDRSGLPKIIPAQLTSENLQRVENFLQIAEIVRGALDRQEIPDYHDDNEQCRQCELRGLSCHPPTLSGEGAALVTSDEVISLVNRAMELRPSFQEYQRLWARIKDRFSETELALVGEYLVEGSYSKSTTYKFPDEETKQKYRVSDPKGRFNLKITPIKAEQGAQNGSN